jgi:hypothetical protein
LCARLGGDKPALSLLKLKLALLFSLFTELNRRVHPRRQGLFARADVRARATIATAACILDCCCCVRALGRFVCRTECETEGAECDRVLQSSCLFGAFGEHELREAAAVGGGKTHQVKREALHVGG